MYLEKLFDATAGSSHQHKKPDTKKKIYQPLTWKNPPSFFSFISKKRNSDAAA